MLIISIFVQKFKMPMHMYKLISIWFRVHSNSKKLAFRKNTSKCIKIIFIAIEPDLFTNTLPLFPPNGFLDLLSIHCCDPTTAIVASFRYEKMHQILCCVSLLMGKNLSVLATSFVVNQHGSLLSFSLWISCL